MTRRKKENGINKGKKEQTKAAANRKAANKEVFKERFRAHFLELLVKNGLIFSPLPEEKKSEKETLPSARIFLVNILAIRLYRIPG